MTITVQKIRPYAKALLIAALLGAAGYVYFFLVYDFYPALTGSQIVSALQKNSSSQTINVKRFEALINELNQKAAATSTPIIPPSPRD